MKKKIIIVTAVLVCLCMVFTGCQKKKSAGDDKVYQLRIGNTTAPDHCMQVAIDKMAEKINERSGGRINAAAYPSSQLGSLRQMTESVMANTLEMCTQSMGGLAAFLPMASVMEMPFLFDSHEHVYKVVDGDIGRDMNKMVLEKTGIRVMGYMMNYYRQTTNNVRPINTPADFRGLTIRVPETKTVMDTITAFGANAVPMAGSELYPAMSQGVVDGQENPVNIIYAAKYYEVQKYLSLTGHIFGPGILIASDKFYMSLPEDLRKIVDEEAANACIFNRSEAERIDNEMLGDLKKYMQVNEVANKEPFRAAVKPVYDEMVKALGSEAQSFFDRIAAARP